MRIYTACPTCGELLLQLDHRTRTCFGCPEPDDYVSRLTRAFLAAAEADRPDADKLAAELDAINDAPPRLLEAALIYASWGWPVFPLQPLGKIPFKGTRGFKDATTDPGLLRAWWRRTPQANIGIATGHRFDVLDVDFRHGALLPWLALKDSPAMPTAHGKQLTRSNGLHILLLPSGGGNLAKAGKLPGLDYRGLGGYIVAAPSVVEENGVRGSYAWSVKPSPMITKGIAEVAT